MGGSVNQESSDFSTKIEIENRIKAITDVVTDQESFSAANILNLSLEIVNVFQNGGKVAFLGNGGSAAEAMHLAAEFTGKCVKEHRPLHAICLNESVSAITAIANDYGFEAIFSRLIQAEMRKEDILVALSTSGTSPNVQLAIETARSMEIKTYLWMGNHPLLINDVEIWKVPSKSTPRIQEVHLMWGHIVSEIVEMHFD